jgi:hypothetical protein
MKRGLQNLIRVLKTTLCVVLSLNIHVFIAGCGQNPLAGPTASLLTVQLTADHPLKLALKGSQFQDATNFIAQPDKQEFRLTFPDIKRQVRGHYAFVDGEFTITEFFFKNTARSAIVTMNDAKQVDTITTSDGYQWKRDGSASREQTDQSAQGVDAYLAANADLIEVARQLDQQSGLTTGSASGSTTSATGTVTPSVVKVSTADTRDSVRAVLAIVASIWAPLVGVLQPLITIFSVSVVLEALLVNRFDGSWIASNADTDLALTIKNGKIDSLIDKASQQQFTIVQSRLDRIDGNHVIWTVEAQILGQDPTVQFTFDMQELANGDLNGTLTALGNNFGRVPVTMTRSI